jgi:hypothetical protein
MARRRTARGRGVRGNSPSWGSAVAALVLVAAAIGLAGAAAVVTVPGSLVLLVLVFARPNGVGARIRRWGVWRRVRGLEATRARATFTVALAIYGVVIPGACLSLLVSSIGSQTKGPLSGASVADTSTQPGLALTSVGGAHCRFCAAHPE